VPDVLLNDISQCLLRAVQGEAIVIIQTIVLKDAFKFQQLGKDGVAIHARNVVDSTMCVIRPVEPAHGRAEWRPNRTTAASIKRASRPRWAAYHAALDILALVEVND
jgi:hypothetical protein